MPVALTDGVISLLSDARRDTHPDAHPEDTVGVGVRVGKGVKVGGGVGVSRRGGGTRVIAKLRHMLITTTRLVIHSMVRARRSFARRKMPPVNDYCQHFHYSTAVRRHKRAQMIP